MRKPSPIARAPRFCLDGINSTTDSQCGQLPAVLGQKQRNLKTSSLIFQVIVLVSTTLLGCRVLSPMNCLGSPPQLRCLHIPIDSLHKNSWCRSEEQRGPDVGRGKITMLQTDTALITAGLVLKLIESMRSGKEKEKCMYLLPTYPLAPEVWFAKIWIFNHTFWSTNWPCFTTKKKLKANKCYTQKIYRVTRSGLPFTSPLETYTVNKAQSPNECLTSRHLLQHMFFRLLISQIIYFHTWNTNPILQFYLSYSFARLASKWSFSLVQESFCLRTMSKKWISAWLLMLGSYST